MDEDNFEADERDDGESYISLSGSSVHSVDQGSLVSEFYHDSDEPTEEAPHFHDNINMDLSLAGMHSYLNKEMEPVVGRTILDAETVYEMFLFWRPRVILVPGQKLPLQLSLHEAEIFVRARDTNKIVGFIASPSDSANLNSCVGTTAELVSILVEETNATVMVVGRQRFKTISVHRRSDNNLVGSVVILCEHSEIRGHSSHPLQNYVPQSWRRYGPSARKYRLDSCSLHYEQLPEKVVSSLGVSVSHQSNNSGNFISRIFRRRPLHSVDSVGQSEAACRQTPLVLMAGDACALMASDQSTWITEDQLKDSQKIVTPAVDAHGRQFSFTRSDNGRLRESRLPARRDLLAATAHSFGRFPSWVYEMYDLDNLISKVTKELREWNSTWRLDHWTQEIGVQFSYWLLQNLPVPDVYKISLLETDHVVARLQGCLRLLLKCSNFLCEGCQEQITCKQKIVCLATEGSLQTFVNPHGILHEMLTVSAVSNVRTQGSATQEYSWFPGYAWTIIQCATCGNHMGWKFTASNSALSPLVFYGVCRSSVVPSFYEGASSIV